jgi:hypothetical protein
MVDGLRQRGQEDTQAMWDAAGARKALAVQVKQITPRYENDSLKEKDCSLGSPNIGSPEMGKQCKFGRKLNGGCTAVLQNDVMKRLATRSSPHRANTFTPFRLFAQTAVP